jgi:hypothetical protein
MNDFRAISFKCACKASDHFLDVSFYPGDEEWMKSVTVTTLLNIGGEYGGIIYRVKNVLRYIFGRTPVYIHETVLDLPDVRLLQTFLSEFIDQYDNPTG